MKFKKQYELCLIPAWRRQYLDYKMLTALLEDACNGQLRPARSTEDQSRRISRSLSRLSRKGANGRTADIEESFHFWQCELQKEVMRVSQFWVRSMDGLEAELAELATMCNDIFQNDERSHGHDKLLELRALQALSRHSDSARKLRNFAELNHVALFKILKKYDKRRCDNSGLRTILTQLVSESGLGNMTRLDRLDSEIRKLSSLSTRCQGLGAEVSAGVLHMVAGVQSRPGFDAPGGLSVDIQRTFFFFLGTSLGLLLAIMILVWLPPEASDEKPFSQSYFLAPFAVFRVGLSVCLTLWGTGAVAHVCHTKGINHLYLLGVDPRCKIGPGFFFTRAAALSTVWILVFGFYVVDYKWMLLPQIGAERGFNLRSSSHYCAYPSILMCIIVVGAIFPSKTAPASYKRGLLGSVARTALAPMFAVSFADNVVGDVLTSLVKPLQDIPPVICYFVSAHPQTARNVERFRKHADVCPSWVGIYLKPIIAVLPLTFRTLQCLRRFRDTRDVKHLFNTGKYCTALAVVIISAWVVKRADNFVDLICLSISTLYSATWDLFLDWGLGSQDLFGVALPGQGRSRNRADEPEATSSSVAVQKRSRFKPTDRTFKPWTYRLCSIFDIAARCSWVITLMPVNIITDNILQREILLVFVTAVEILRRSMWAVLRIENEQYTNAGGFRAILWVPNILETETEQLEQLGSTTHYLGTSSNGMRAQVSSTIGTSSNGMRAQVSSTNGSAVLTNGNQALDAPHQALDVKELSTHPEHTGASSPRPGPSGSNADAGRPLLTVS